MHSVNCCFASAFDTKTKTNGHKSDTEVVKNVQYNTDDCQRQWVCRHFEGNLSKPKAEPGVSDEVPDKLSFSLFEGKS